MSVSTCVLGYKYVTCMKTFYRYIRHFDLGSTAEMYDVLDARSVVVVTKWWRLALIESSPLYSDMFDDFSKLINTYVYKTWFPIHLRINCHDLYHYRLPQSYWISRWISQLPLTMNLWFWTCQNLSTIPLTRNVPFMLVNLFQIILTCHIYTWTSYQFFENPNSLYVSIHRYST